MTAPRQGQGPLRSDQLPQESRFELSGGRKVYCAPSGGQHAGGNAVGALPLSTDPDVTEAGVDAGYATDAGTVRAPDIAVGNVPMQSGWISGAPPLAVEYADKGQDEGELRDKIRDLLSAGTRYVWVVRLTGPRRVEVHEPGRAIQTVLPGQMLSAPGVLRNDLLVEALYEPEAARKATLRNLLQRVGYEDLDAVRAETWAEAQAETRAGSVLRVLALRGIVVSPDEAAQVRATRDAATLDRWLQRALTAQAMADVLAHVPVG